MNLIYAGVVLFGAMTLLVEANRNFAVSARHQPFKFYPILKDVEARNLCSSRDWAFGFTAYSMLYLVSYAVLLGSAELYTLVRSLDLSQFEVGSTGSIINPDSDPLNLRGTDYEKPIFVSAFIILFFSLGATKPIESNIRVIAHRLAGVPRGVHQVLDRLHHPEFYKLAKQRSGPLVNRFREQMQNINFDLGKKPGWKGYIGTIENSLEAIDCLSPSVTGEQRAAHFPQLNMDQLQTISKNLKDEIEPLRATIGDLEASEEKLEKLQELSLKAANSTKAVFAVYYIRNGRAIMNLDRGSSLDKIEAFIRKTYRVEQNSFAIAIFLSLIISLVVGFFNYRTYRIREVNVDPGLLPPGEGKAFFGFVERMRENPLSEVPIAEQVLNVLNAPHARAIDAYISSKFSQFFEFALWDSLKFLFAVSAVILAAIFIREVRIEQSAWRSWDWKRMPFLRLLSASFIPCLIGGLAFISVFLIELLWNSGFNITQTQIAVMIDGYWPFYLANFPAFYWLALTSLVLMDKHNNLPAFWTMVIAICACVIYVGLAHLTTFTYWTSQPLPDGGISEQWRDTISLAILPVAFILIFAAALEQTEANEGDPISQNGEQQSENAADRWKQLRSALNAAADKVKRKSQ